MDNGITAVIDAIETNNDNAVIRLIAACADVNITDSYGHTVLFYAVQQFSRENVVRALIRAGADVKVEDNDGQTALFYAVQQSNNQSVVRALIDNGADVNKTDNDKVTALFYAVQQSKNESVVRALIDAGADVELEDDEGKTALFYAADNQNIEDETMLQALVEGGNAFVNAKDIHGRTPLFYAITNSIALARYLVDHGGNIHAIDSCDVSILSFLIEDSFMKQGSSCKFASLFEVFSLLIEKGIKRQSIVQTILNLVFCKIPLLLTASECKTIQLISPENISKALDVARQYVDEGDDEQKQTILMIERKATSGEVLEAFELLVELGANPDSCDTAGNTALHYSSCLSLFGVSQKIVMKLCDWLRRGHFNRKNHQTQTPLLFCLSENHRKFMSTTNQWSGVKTLLEVCKFMMKNGSNVCETSNSGESVFHLLMKLFQKGLELQDKDVRQNALHEIIELLQLFSSAKAAGMIVNKTDVDLNSPLHLWASLALPSPQDYTSTITKDYTFEKILEIILECLLKCGAKLNARNINEETPLHLCNTWSAVKLLTEKEECRPNDLDLLKRSPLLVAAAKNGTFLKLPDCFFPDVSKSEDPKTFWKTAIIRGLDPWTVDKQGECVLGILIESNVFVLSKALVDVACEENFIQNDTFLKTLLITICKDKSERANWKTFLVQGLMKSRNITNCLEEPLNFCLKNMTKLNVFHEKRDAKEESSKQKKYSSDEKRISNEVQPLSDKRKVDESVIEEETTTMTTDISALYESVHYKIAQQLLRESGLADSSYRIPDSLNESFLDVAESYPALKDILEKLKDDTPKRINWTPVSKRYKDALQKVYFQEGHKIIETVWYHEDHIGSGSFGHVFVGINTTDGREVAIKRIENQGADREEMITLRSLADCEQVVRYLLFFETKDFSYVILELMEGNLDEYLKEMHETSKSTQLCEDIVKGLKYLHEQSILHRDLKPANILYKTHPKLCLKIADFGLSHRIDSSSTKVHGTKVGTKCWTAPELLKNNRHYSKSSDTFSCGLLLYYILSERKHPFCPADRDMCTGNTLHETEANMIKGKLTEGWDNSLSPEATHLFKKMLQLDEKKRPTAGETVQHPLFWSKEKKTELLIAVSNQPEFQGLKKSLDVGQFLERNSATILGSAAWNDPRYKQMPLIYAEMGEKRKYDTKSAIELVRFIDDAYEVTAKKATPIRKLLLEDFVFLDCFPHLVMVVYEAVTTFKWDCSKNDIAKLISNGKQFSSQRTNSTNPELFCLDKVTTVLVPWTSISNVYKDMLTNVANHKECEEVGPYWYHKNYIAKGQFGHVFAGINKMDGREVAIKRIVKQRMEKPKDKREIKSLTRLADCEQVVRYLFFFEHEEFSYVILELMEGNLDRYLSGSFDPTKSTLLCKEVVMGVKYLHEQKILHRDLKPSNILYKEYPKLCLKIADFGLSRCFDSTGSTSVYGSNSGTRCWIAPEVLDSSSDHSQSSDIFSCGLVLFYIFSVKKHPFSPIHCGDESESHKTEDNIMNGKMVGWDKSLSPEASHLIRQLLKHEDYLRETAAKAITHPLFWPKKKKMDFLCAVGNQPEFSCPRSKRTSPLTEVELTLETNITTICEHGNWLDQKYVEMPNIYAKMTKVRRVYDTYSVVELLRFIRNTYAHVSSGKRKKQLYEEFLFLDYFPHLVIEVYKALTTHGWDRTRGEIEYALKK